MHTHKFLYLISGNPGSPSTYLRILKNVHIPKLGISTLEIHLNIFMFSRTVPYSLRFYTSILWNANKIVYSWTELISHLIAKHNSSFSMGMKCLGVYLWNVHLQGCNTGLAGVTYQMCVFWVLQTGKLSSLYPYFQSGETMCRDDKSVEARLERFEFQSLLCHLLPL